MSEPKGRGFGATLRAAREEADRGLEDVAAATRIPQRFLEALEEEQWASLPSGVIGRGFARLAAKELGLPVEDVLTLYRQAREGEETEARLVPPQQAWRVDFRRERAHRPVLLGILLLLGGALGVWVWSPWSLERTPPAEEAAPPGEAPAPHRTPPAPPADAPAPPAPAPAAAVDPVPSPPAAPLPPPPPAPETHRLEILAVERVWVRVAADGGRAEERLLQPGQRQIYDIRREASLRLGNAGGVRLIWNGESLKVPGPPGAVLNLDFPEALEGLRP